jgi:hypothetical protein
MQEYKSVQDLILKAALCDGVSTTIRPTPLAYNAVEIVFSKGVDRTSVIIDLAFTDEYMVLHMLRTTLFRLFEEPYRNIVVKEG